jgi:predicted peroxiredoxin
MNTIFSLRRKMMKKLNYTLVLVILLFAVIGMFSVAGQFSSVITGSPALAAPPVPTPRAAEDLKGGLFVNLSTDQIDRAAMAVSLATMVLKNTEKPVTIFLNVDGVRLADTSIPQNIHKSEKTLAQMLTNFMAEGGVVLICPTCMKNVGGISEDQLLEGVIIGSPEYTWSAMFAEDVTVLSY